MQPKLIITFGPLSGPDFLTKVGSIVAALRANPDFPEPWPPQVPTFAQLDAAYHAYQDALVAAANRDRIKIAERDRARETLTGILRSIAGYLEVVAQGDTTKLVGTGYDLRKDIVRGTGEVAVPMDFHVKRSDISGRLLVHAASVAGAASYEAGLAETDPMAESSWRDAGTFAGCSHIELSGLTPAKVYWVRLRAIGSNGPGPWTDALSMMVV